ncbi:polymeric immunoglobulin receptor-like [Xyrauchen texanus]|uniref:polymeric immunoglobulin receptor-like n=1 Tax=Xyrauchen texanus TaxID=154827 RepID=UPI002241F969|nr:polymeric immunoglobulin receptor-like [Xyrauchen texanus]
MMKILLLFFTILIMGHVSCTTDNVTGITGGSVIVTFKTPENSRQSPKSFCKKTDDECTTVTTAQDHLWIPDKRFSMTENKSVGFLSVLIRNLTITDTGEYKFKAGSKWSEDVTLHVQHEPCCGTLEKQTADLGGTVTIRCKYPETYKYFAKLLFKVQNGSLQTISSTRGATTGDRFSLNVNWQENVFTVTIINVNKHDDGVYVCGAFNTFGEISYNSLLTEVHLHITDPTGASDIYVIIIMSVCLTLLLIGGLSLLLLKLRRDESNGSISSPNQTNTRDCDEVCTTVYYENQTLESLYVNIKP